MQTIDIFYQGEGIHEMDCLEAQPDHTIAVIKENLIKKHGFEAEILIFLEGHEAPLEDDVLIKTLCGAAVVKIHLHRCRKVAVSVTFAGETVHHAFAPAITVARIKHWAAVQKFHMTEAEAGEHHLQLSGTQNRPAPGAHVGSLTSSPACSVSFDLVPDQRVNGASI